MNNKIILVGFKGSGKNTVGEYLVNRYGYIGISFADALKDAVAAIFCWDRNLLEGNTPESRIWRETVDFWWSKRLGIPNFTPRWMLQNFGTQIMREHFNPNIWITNVERRILDLGDKPIVVFDGRFPNEIDLLTRQFNGTSIRVKRGEEPVWFDLARQSNEYEREGFADENILRWKLRDVFKVHESEYAWIGHTIDMVIENDNDIDHLHARVDEMMSNARN